MLQLRHHSVRTFLDGVMDLMRIFICTLSMLISSLSCAGTVVKLYSTELPITSLAETPNDLQVTEGLRQVLVKVSGDRAIDQKPAIQQQLSMPRPYLQQFSFTSGAVESENRNALVLDFNRNSVDKLIQSTGIKPLGSQRPTLLIWLATDESTVQDYASLDSRFIQKIRQTAEERGLPLQFPLLDLQDQVALPVSDVWGLFEDSVAVASQRYRPDAILVARVEVKPSGVAHLEGVLMHEANSERLSKSGQTDTLLVEAMNQAADQLFMPVVSHELSYFQTGVAVKVNNINSLSDYINLTELLTALPIVNKAQPEWVRGSEVTIRLQLDGDELQLMKALGIEERLQAMDQQLDSDGLKIFSYRWQG